MAMTILGKVRVGKLDMLLRLGEDKRRYLGNVPWDYFPNRDLTHGCGFFIASPKGGPLGNTSCVRGGAGGWFNESS
jgi:hypothetical protein